MELTIDPENGRLNVDSKSHELLADTSSEILLMQALQRRALAYDQANIIENRGRMASEVSQGEAHRRTRDCSLSCKIQPEAGFRLARQAGIIDKVMQSCEVVGLMVPLSGSVSLPRHPTEGRVDREGPLLPWG